MNLKLRSANFNDAVLLFEWVNNPLVRSNSFNRNPIEWTAHCVWLNNKLESDDSYILILHSDEPIGQIRFDKQVGSNVWQMDYSISINFRKQGFGKILVKKGIDFMIEHNQGCSLIAQVKCDNASSIRVFEQLQFESNEQKDFIEFCLKL